MTSEDLLYMRLAIEEAKKSKGENSIKPHPFVGAVIVKDGEELGRAFRGELGPGDHAEFTVLEGKLKAKSVTGATVYVTLEPCTKRGPEKIACVERLIERKVAKVFIGMLDPNDEIRGKGQIALFNAGIETALFPQDLMQEIAELNRDFIRYFKNPLTSIDVDYQVIGKKSLDQCYATIRSIYSSRNISKDVNILFAHLVEIIGSMSVIASNKQKRGVDPGIIVAKAIAWWMAICDRLGIESVENLIWAKFPCVCAYCLEKKHDNDICADSKKKFRGPRWARLTEIGKTNDKPLSISGWQKMFYDIYPVQQTEDVSRIFSRLNEELGELAEAIRIFPVNRGYFISEAADVFAWLMHLQNIIDHHSGIPREKRGQNLELAFAKIYPDKCIHCNLSVCACTHIIESTVGRIAHEVPDGYQKFYRNY